MKLGIQALIILQSATVAWMLVRYDPDEHYAAAAQQTTSVVLSGMLDTCRKMVNPVESVPDHSQYKATDTSRRV